MKGWLISCSRLASQTRRPGPPKKKKRWGGRGEKEGRKGKKIQGGKAKCKFQIKEKKVSSTFISSQDSWGGNTLFWSTLCLLPTASSSPATLLEP
jgi:hypothetical protein